MHWKCHLQNDGHNKLLPEAPMIKFTDAHLCHQEPELLGKIHVKFHVNLQAFSNMASDLLAAVQPANQMPGLKIFVS